MTNITAALLYTTIVTNWATVGWEFPTGQTNRIENLVIQTNYFIQVTNQLGGYYDIKYKEDRSNNLGVRIITNAPYCQCP